MFWVILCWAVSIILVTSPMLWALLFVHSKTYILSLYNYTPQQFIFLLGPFAIAAYCSFLAFLYTLRLAKSHSADDVQLSWFAANWVVPVLFGVIIVSIITATDYLNSAKAFPTMRPEYAQKSLEAAISVKKQIEEKTDVKERETIRQAITFSAQKALNNLEKSSAISRNSIMQLDDGLFLKIVMTSKYQRGLGILDDVMLALTVLQLFAALLTAFLLVLSGYVAYVISRVAAHEEINNLTILLKFGVAAFCVFPVCYAYFRAEMQLILDFTSTTKGDWLAALAIISLSLVIMSVDGKNLSVISVFYRGLPLVIMLGSSLVVAYKGPLMLRSFIGADSNIGTTIILQVILLLILAGVVGSTWPSESSREST